MFTHELSQTRSDYFDHFVPSMGPCKVNNSLVSSTFLSPTPSNFSDSGSYQQSPLSIYNSYNPNYHHHHYYFHPNFQDYNYSSQPTGNFYDTSSNNWMRKYDYENQKEYFIANSPPTPTECCDFEVPQQVAPSPKPATLKLFSDLDKIFFDDQHTSYEKDQHTSNNPTRDSCDAYSFWENENICNIKDQKRVPKSRANQKRGNAVKREIAARKSKLESDEGWWEFVSKLKILRNRFQFPKKKSKDKI